MPRKVSSSSHSAPKSSLALSSFHLRLEALEKEHIWLLKQIKRKRTELNNFVEQMRSLATDIFHRGADSFKQLAEVDQEIHRLFEEIFATRKFGKQTKKDIEAVYLNLQLTGIITPKLDLKDQDSELDELFEAKEQENDFSDSTQEYGQHQQTQQELEAPSSGKSEESRKIRQTFLRLAEIFHPDKVTDGETQMRHTEIMKEINRAYQEGDLARLLEIEQTHQEGQSITGSHEDDLTRRSNRLERDNEFLKTQYETLKHELRLVKNTPEGVMVSDYRRATRNGIDPINQMLEQVASEIQVVCEIRNFVKDLRDQKITIKEFLAGPSFLHRMNREMVEDLLEEMFGDLGDTVIL